MHGARRVVRREIQRLEIVPVILDLRPFRQLVAQPAENSGDAFQGTGDRMQANAVAIAARQGDVDGFGDQPRVQCGFQQRLALGQRTGQCVAGLVDRFTSGLALLGRQGTELLELRGDAAAPSRATRSCSNTSGLCAAATSASAWVVRIGCRSWGRNSSRSAIAMREGPTPVATAVPALPLWPHRDPKNGEGRALPHALL